MVGVLALISAGSLLAYNIFSALTKSQISKEQQVDIRPLSGNLNPKVLSNLSKRRQFSRETLSGVKSIDYSMSETVEKTATILDIAETATTATESASER